MRDSDKPNVVYILTDQWRAKATGYNGDPNANTPYIDQLAKESVDFANAIGTDSFGNIYVGEVDNAKRIQKFEPVMSE